MTKIVFTVAVLMTVFTVQAQKKSKAASVGPKEQPVSTIPLQADNWTFQPSKVEFVEHRSVPSMKILPRAGKVVLKNFNFSSGTIEFDQEMLDVFADAIYFRYRDEKENEIFYFRTQSAGNPAGIQAIQYAPLIDGVNMWDMYFQYQTYADFKKNQWNHVKLVIAGQQMKVYVNNNPQPQLVVPRLEGNTTHGTLAFEGEMVISNLVVKPGQVEGMDSTAGFDPEDNDPRYIRQWEVSAPVATEKDVDFNTKWIPDSTTTWKPLAAERRGLVNLTRQFGQSKERRMVWLRAKVNMPAERIQRMRLGFSDEVWVFLNKQPLYFDKNYFGTPEQKGPGGRCNIENAEFLVPFKEGENELLIGVANDFYGWGIKARLENLTSLL